MRGLWSALVAAMASAVMAVTATVFVLGQDQDDEPNEEVLEACVLLRDFDSLLELGNFDGLGELDRTMLAARSTADRSGDADAVATFDELSRLWTAWRNPDTVDSSSVMFENLDEEPGDWGDDLMAQRGLEQQISSKALDAFSLAYTDAFEWCASTRAGA